MRLPWTWATPLVSQLVVLVVMAVAAAAAAMPTAAAAVAGPLLVPRVGMETIDAEALVAIVQQLRSHSDALDTSFLGLCGILVFLMQTGFAMLTVGYVGGSLCPSTSGLAVKVGGLGKGGRVGGEGGWGWKRVHVIVSGWARVIRGVADGQPCAGWWCGANPSGPLPLSTAGISWLVARSAVAGAQVRARQECPILAFQEPDRLLYWRCGFLPLWVRCLCFLLVLRL